MKKNMKAPLLQSINSDVEMEKFQSLVGKNNGPEEEKKQEVQKCINCASCNMEIMYSGDCYYVQCLRCLGVTATKALSSMFCVHCGTTIFYLCDSAGAICKCGRFYKIPNYNSS